MTFEHEGKRIAYRFLPPRNAEQLALKSQYRFGRKPPWVNGTFPEFVAELMFGLLDWTHASTTNNGPKIPELFIIMPATMIFA
jgi:hypothetical protein